MSWRSWVNGRKFKLKSAFDDEDVQLRLRKIERAIELEYLAKPQAEADANLTKAAGEFLRSLDDYDDAVVRLGSLLIIKKHHSDGNRLVVLSLSQAEIQRIEAEPSLLAEPERLLSLLGSTRP